MWLSSDSYNVNKIVNISINYFTDARLDCKNELIKYVHEIVATMPAPYTLFVSGGIDSQAMVYIWKLANVQFDVVHVNYEGFNLHDRDQIVEFCKTHEVALKVIDFDLVDFLENRLDRYALEYSCASPQLCTHMAFSEMVQSGTKVFSGNLATRSLSLDNTIFGLYRYAQHSGHSVVPFFLLQSQSASKASIIKADHLPNAVIGGYEGKCAHYRSLGIPIIPQNKKLNGFEMVKCFYDNYPERVTPQMKLMHINTRSKRVFDQLFRNKYLIQMRNHYTPKLVVAETNKTYKPRKLNQ